MFPPPPRVKRDNASDGKFSALPEATDEVCAHVFIFVDIVCCFCWGGSLPPRRYLPLRANTRRPPRRLYIYLLENRLVLDRHDRIKECGSR